MAPAQYMEMKVKYGLAAMHTGVNDEAVPVTGDPLPFCDLIADQHQMSQ